jgi:hypothetical protein
MVLCPKLLRSHISQCLALTTFAVAALLAGHYTARRKDLDRDLER